MDGHGVLPKMYAVRASTHAFTKHCCLNADYVGFAVFFSLFELTRQAAQRSQILVETVLSEYSTSANKYKLKEYMPRIIHGTTLVSGGVIAGLAYEICGRPWDVARKVVHIHCVTGTGGTSAVSIVRALVFQAQSKGVRSYFQDTSSTSHTSARHHGRMYAALRLLARVGPWGAGFLLWEAFGPGLNTKERSYNSSP